MINAFRGKKYSSILFAFIFTVGLLALGYYSFGIWTTLVFSSGFLGGFLIWLILPVNHISFTSIKKNYWLTFAAFIFLHRVEENIFKFQEKLSRITGTPVPELNNPNLILLVLGSVGAWLSIPILIKRKADFGYYLAWTFYSAMGITELTHFIFPFFTPEKYSYFPGMLSVLVLAPTAWWGMRKLAKASYSFRLKRIS